MTFHLTTLFLSIVSLNRAILTFFLRIVIYCIKLPLLVTKYELQDIESQLRVIKSELQDILAILTYFLQFFYRICDINSQLRYKSTNCTI